MSICTGKYLFSPSGPSCKKNKENGITTPKRMKRMASLSPRGLESPKSRKKLSLTSTPSPSPRHVSRSTSPAPVFNFRGSSSSSSSSSSKRSSIFAKLKVFIPDEGEKLESIVSMNGSPRVITPIPSCREQTVSGNNFSVSMRRGNRKNQQDAFCALPEVSNDPHKAFFGAFDGHGEKGQEASEFAAEFIGRLVSETKDFDKDIHASFTKVFAAADETFVEKKMEGSTSGGTTAVTAYVDGRKKSIWVAHVGDSRAVLSKDGVAVALTNDHTACRKDERERIEALGGRVLHIGTWRVGGTLAVSRSIGDMRYKDVVCAEPDVVQVDITDSTEFIILATDGLWGLMSNQEAVDIARSCVTPEEASSKLADTALKRGGMDNVCVVVLDLKGYIKRLSRPSSPDGFVFPTIQQQQLQPFVTLSSPSNAISVTSVSSSPRNPGLGSTPSSRERTPLTQLFLQSQSATPLSGVSLASTPSHGVASNAMVGVGEGTLLMGGLTPSSASSRSNSV